MWAVWLRQVLSTTSTDSIPTPTSNALTTICLIIITCCYDPLFSPTEVGDIYASRKEYNRTQFKDWFLKKKYF
jgi:hypothetical protein